MVHERLIPILKHSQKIYSQKPLKGSVQKLVMYFHLKGVLGFWDWFKKISSFQLRGHCFFFNQSFINRRKSTPTPCLRISCFLIRHFYSPIGQLQLTFISSAVLFVLMKSLIMFLVKVIPWLDGRKLYVWYVKIMIIKYIESNLYIIEVIFSFQALYVAGYGICI